MAVTAEAQFHVLAVDDSLIDRKLIERLLRTSSYQVTTVDSGSKALELLGLQDGRSDDSPSRSASNQEIAVNLVITDYCMPGMTGYDLLKKIKETSPLKDIPVVIMSSENVPSRISRCLEGGAEEFFLKPVQLSDMAKLVPHIMKGKSREQQKGQAERPQEPPPPQHERTNYSDQITATTAQKSSSNSNKRKTMEEGLPPEKVLSPERTRPRYTVAA